MRTIATGSTARTYIEDPVGQRQVEVLIGEIEQHVQDGGAMYIVSPDGQKTELPGRLFDILAHAARVLARGQGLTIAPQDAQLTTQEAADFLGISRPTLVKYLESGRIDFDKVGRHRRVMLTDLIEFQARGRAERQASLRRNARGGQEAGMLDVVYEPNGGGE